MFKHGVIRTDSVKATKATGYIRSAKFFNSLLPAPIDNGNLVKVEDLLHPFNEREIFRAEPPSKLTDLNIGVVATPELIYDESMRYKLYQFTNNPDEIITVILLAQGDIISVSDSCIISLGETPQVGNYVTLTEGVTLWSEKTELEGTESLYGKIVAREMYNKGEYLNVINIIKAN